MLGGIMVPKRKREGRENLSRFTTAGYLTYGSSESLVGWWVDKLSTDRILSQTRISLRTCP